MKLRVLLILLASVLTMAYAFSEDFDIPDEIDDEELDEDEEILRLLEEKRILEDLKRENEHARDLASKYHAEHGLVQGTDSIRMIYDPCTKIHCGAGRVCQVEDFSAHCVCIPECPEETDPRRKVCTNRNETWGSDCEVHRQRCLCDTKDDRCSNSKNSHIHIDYYGECKQLQICTEEEMIDFPRRMREWLFHVMKELVGRQELNKELVEKLTSKYETELNKKWARAAVWKFCDLDATHDRSVSRHELFPIRAPLISLEHCISPFLESCDADNDHRITLKEWGKCLGLEDGDLEDRCEEIFKSKDNNI
ncbi:CLUMA_CG020115, isoform A [Clunio marinus]|uniref:CLUMA_CG020115, isoform A n=1 Tax=Clunio marinus TaxID=568069 RepID=A0A1J1J6K9_9DIPT|nr:CLUMA_CG020115, isoform A [Clunio marinus]